MTRVGQNPAKLGMRSYQPQELGIATVLFIPSLEGYFQDCLEIFKLMLASIEMNTPDRYDLLVFDNGSCQPAKDELARLQSEGRIRWLFHSNENLGKTGAQNWIFGSMPNEWICYTDSDVLFRKGWLQASMEIIRCFPSAGMVGAQPCFFDVLKGKGTAHQTLLSKPGFSLESYTPSKRAIDEYCRGINASDELAAKYHSSALSRIKNEKDACYASLGASHMQFLVSKKMARKIIPLPDRSGLSQEEDRQLDLNIDNAGGLHLSTIEPYVVHLGNVLDEWAKEMVVEAGVPATFTRNPPVAKKMDGGWITLTLSRLVEWKWARIWLTRLYNKLFQILSDKR